MKSITLLFVLVILISCQESYVINFEKTTDGVVVTTIDGTLGIYPQT